MGVQMQQGQGDTVSLVRGRYRIRLAETPEDLDAAQQFRARVFLGAENAEARDTDGFDARSKHCLIQDVESGALVGCYRFLHLARGPDIERSYAAQFYDLSNLHGFPEGLLEIGRFCIDPDRRDPDILRTAWASITRFVDDHSVGMMFGCTSFQGVDGSLYADPFSYLCAHHAAPPRWSPQKKLEDIVTFAPNPLAAAELRRAKAKLPPLLRTYLTMGGWVSDHAVIDRELGTIHVFTGVEIAAIPPTRAALLRKDAESSFSGGVR